LAKPHRFLGFAFAAADLLVEVAPDGRVTFAMGAGEALMGAADTALIGAVWSDRFDPTDRPMLQALFRGLTHGGRVGPVVIKVVTAKGKPEAFVSLTAIRLPQNEGAVSCVLAKADARGPAGMQSQESFEARAGELLAQSPEELELAFVELAGLSGTDQAKADPAALQAMLAGILRAQAYRGEAPTDLGQDRFALIRDRKEPAALLAERVARLLSDEGVKGVAAGAANMPLTGGGSPRQVVQALRYALNQVLRDGLSRPLPEDLAEALDRAMKVTLSKAGALGAAIQHRQFNLAYQPVVSLSDGSLHHHEVLVRFGDNNSPFPTIRMAEELDLIGALDSAILEETLAVLQRDPRQILAVNVSGRSLISEGFVGRAVQLLKSRPSVRGRLLIELTESAAVEDLALADRHLKALRDAGCEICLDDFGAGAASLAYLQQLTLDVLKIDGRYIRDLQHGGRESTFVKHLVNMCAELKIRTLAEMVETVEAEHAVRLAGVDYAQGWLYGRATDAPQDAASFAPRGAAAPIGVLAMQAAAARQQTILR
jgi:EAL domain-containing protein (putative c-di-GMP-specific phosphodiesterase class I)